MQHPTVHSRPCTPSTPSTSTHLKPTWALTKLSCCSLFQTFFTPPVEIPGEKFSNVLEYHICWLEYHIYWLEYHIYWYINVCALTCQSPCLNRAIRYTRAAQSLWSLTSYLCVILCWRDSPCQTLSAIQVQIFLIFFTAEEMMLRK